MSNAKYAKQVGEYGEKLAEKYLRRRCYRVVSNNFKAHGGEIDLIAFRFGVLVFAEVKTRTNQKYGLPADAVDEIKIQRINTAARAFLQAYCAGGKLPVGDINGKTKYKKIRKTQIDVIEVYLNNGKPKINHIKQFYTGE